MRRKLIIGKKNRKERREKKTDKAEKFKYRPIKQIRTKRRKNNKQKEKQIQNKRKKKIRRGENVPRVAIPAKFPAKIPVELGAGIMARVIEAPHLHGHVEHIYDVGIVCVPCSRGWKGEKKGY